MDIKKWAEKYAAGLQDWIKSLDDNLVVDLGDVDEEETDEPAR